MQITSKRRSATSENGFDVLSSMIIELVRHHERQRSDNETIVDWESATTRTRIIKYGTRANLYNVLKQVPDSVAAEYQLSYQGMPVLSWKEYRWPHLHDRQPHAAQGSICLPQECFDELLQYHVDARTSWLSRYRALSSRSSGYQPRSMKLA